MSNPPPNDSTRFLLFCPNCRTLLCVVNDQGELAAPVFRVAWGVIYCLACGERVEWRQRDAESGG